MLEKLSIDAGKGTKQKLCKALENKMLAIPYLRISS